MSGPPPPESRTAAHRELPRQILTHHRVLGERLYQHGWIRLLLAAAIVVGAFVARWIVGVRELEFAALVLLGLCIAAYNAVVARWTRPHRHAGATHASHRLLLRTMYGAIVLDYLALTVAIWLVGGTRSPFLSFYLLHVIVSGILLSRRAALTFHAVAYALLVLLVLGEWSGWIPPRTPSGAVAGSGPLDGRYAITVLLVYAMLFGLTAFILVSFSNKLRAAEQRIRLANADLTRLANMRRDFLDIALHNLQSPIGVATMHLRNLRDGLGGPVTGQQRTWLDRSLERLGGLAQFMRALQTLSSLESIRVGDRSAPVDLAALLRAVVAEYHEQAGQHGITLRLELEEPLPPVPGIELLLREAIANYVTNAIRYTPEGGTVTVGARPAGARVVVEVADTGIGISEEDRERLFSEFVRLRHKGQPIAKVRGTGLGLTIVKRIVEAHHGEVGVDSRPGEGSRFWLALRTGPDPGPPAASPDD